MFELDRKPSRERWSFDLALPDDWSIGLIVGASGSGKSTVGRHLFGDDFAESVTWPKKGTVIDGFSKSTPIKEVCSALSSVGFSSPPAWLRPFEVLSNGQKFRAEVARALTSDRDLVVIDEFTSVVDRDVAKIGSAAVSKAVRRGDKQLVAISCHYDVIEWLQPCWVLHMPTGRLDRRSVQQRPDIEIEVKRVPRSFWSEFSRHHYLNHQIANSAACFVAFWDQRPVAFASSMFFPHPKRSGWREHRTVCLPDFQGVGIGNKLSETVAAAYRATGKPYRSTTSHPAMIGYRARSQKWKMIRPPSRVSAPGKTSKIKTGTGTSKGRITAGFEFVGPPNRKHAKTLGLI
jgi:energy-coupling factor transporter ATP-binding protein EcfA2